MLLISIRVVNLQRFLFTAQMKRLLQQLVYGNLLEWV